MQTDSRRPRRRFGWLIAILTALALSMAPQWTVAQQSPQEIWDKARNGDTDAQVQLGYHYLADNHADHDLSTARYWFGQAAEAGSSEAAAQLGICCSITPSDPKIWNWHWLHWQWAQMPVTQRRSSGWLRCWLPGWRSRRPMPGGHGHSTSSLPRNNTRAPRSHWESTIFKVSRLNSRSTGQVALFRASAAQNNAMGQYHMFALHLSGAIEGADPDVALSWLIKAVEQDLPQALFALGQLHIRGNLVAKNRSRGFELVSQAARAGLSEAQFQLGLGSQWRLRCARTRPLP